MALYVQFRGFADCSNPQSEEEDNACSKLTVAAHADATNAALVRAGVDPETAAQVAPVADRVLPAVDSFGRDIARGNGFDFAKLMSMLGQKNSEPQVNYFGARKPSMLPVVLGVSMLGLVTLAVLAARSK